MSVRKALAAAGDLAHNDAGKPNYVYEFNPSVANKWFNLDAVNDSLVGGGLGKVRIARFGVHGDGSCAYHTLCVALNVDDYVHQTDEKQKQIVYKFRCSFADSLTQDKLKKILLKSKANSKPESILDLQENLCDPKVWADETALRIVSDALDINLIFLDLEKNQVYCGMHHDDALDSVKKLPKTIVVCWVSHAHFEPLAHLVKVGPRVTEVKVMLEPAASHTDALLVQALMSKYKNQCAIKRR